MTTTRALAVEGIARLAPPRNQKGLGDIILSPDSPKLIPGVKAAPIKLWPDDRGYFLEIQRMRQGLPRIFRWRAARCRRR